MSIKSYVNVRLMSSSLSLHHGDTDFPTSPSLGQFTIVNGVLDVYTQVEGIDAWRPLTKQVQQYKHVQSVASSSWQIEHNLSSQDLIIGVYDENNDIHDCSSITFVDDDNIIVNFSEPIRGRCLVFSMTDSYSTIFANFTAYTETVTDLGVLNVDTTIDVKLSTIQVLEIGSSVSTLNITFVNWPAPSTGKGASVVLSIKNGGEKIVWPSSVKWGQGVTPTLTSSGIDRLIFTTDDGGINIYGFVAALDLK